MENRALGTGTSTSAFSLFSREPLNRAMRKITIAATATALQTTMAVVTTRLRSSRRCCC